MTDYSDLVARARGLSGHLLRPEQIATLCNCSATQLAVQLAALGAIAPDAGGRDAGGRDAAGPLDSHDLERALRDHAAGRLQVLARWSGSRYAALAALFDEEDLRSLRALVRGIVTGVAPEDRAKGLIATPGLPSRALSALASSGDVANLASMLVTWQHPYGSAMAVEAARGRPELLRFEVALARVFADRAHTASRHDRMLRLFAERIIDLANLWTALVLANHAADVDAGSLFVEGGRHVRQSDLAFALGAAHREPLTQRLLPRVAGTPLAAALDATEGHDAEDAALDAMVEEFRLLARRDPTSLAPVIAFVLQQRAELRTLLRIVWSVSLGIPSVMIRRSVGVAA